MLRRCNRLASSRRLGTRSCPYFWRPAFEPLEDRRLLSAVVTNSLDSGAGSLRQAILDTNATLGLDDITFNIPGAGPHTIAPLSQLPTITDPVFIDGWSEPDFAGSPVIELDGGGVVTTGLRIESGFSTVRGLAIGNFDAGLELDVVGGNQVVGNYIGVDADGVTARPNVLRGISVTSDGNNIGSTLPQDRNVISDNTNIGIYIASADAIQIRGNYIGVLPDGVSPAGNFTGVHVIGIASNITIGGTTAEARNVISGNNEGVYIDSQGANNVVQGNYLGVGADGTSKVANVDGLVVYTGATDVTIGGITPGARNVFANSKTGIWVFSSDATRIQGNYIGVLADGVTAAGNQMGVQVDGTASNTTIGGTTEAARNIISGNGTGVRALSAGANNVVQGNFIGLGANGLTVVPNLDGIYVQDGGFAIGGLVSGARNVIVGNTNNGVWLSSTDNVQVQGNYIGVLPDGITAAGNPHNGVVLDGAAENTTIGGTTSAARNIISGNGAGISTFSIGLNNVVQGNYIGVGADGVTAVPNLDGIHVHDDGLTIGGVVSGARNVIAGNILSGILLDSATGVQVQGNYIGLLPDGVTAADNFTGVLLEGTASNNMIGGSDAAARNIISANTHGVRVQDASLNNTIRGNSIYANAQLGIDLGSNGPTPNDADDADSGPHGLQNFPVITSASHGAATHVIGTIASTANTTFHIDFYANAAAGLSGLGEGERYLGSVTVITDGAGNASFDVNGLGASQSSEFITATATGPEGTSEFSTGIDPLSPFVDLNGAPGGTDRTVTWTNAGAVIIPDAAAALVTDTGTIASLTATIPVAQSGDALSATASGGITVSYDAGNQILKLTGVASAAAYQTVLRTIKYNNILGGPGAGSFIVNFVANDGSVNSATAVGTVAVVVAPRVDLNGNQIAGGNNYTSTWSNLGAVNIADPFVGVVFDGQAPNLISMTATLVSPAAGDALSATAAGGISISYDATNGILKMSNNATQANYQTVLRSVKYTSSIPVNLISKTVNFVGTDAVSSSPTAVATITIAPLKLDLNGDLALGTGYNTFWTNTGAVNITGSTGVTATTVVDGKAANLSSVTATIVGVHAGDLLSATASGGITVSYDVTNQVLNMTGSDTLANYQTVLRSVKYDNSSGGPGTSPITVNFLATNTLAHTSAATSTVQIVLSGAQVVGRQLFYNQSGTSSPLRYDGNNAAINSNDDNAIALDKVAYIPNGVASTFANVSSYSKGINGLMIDLAGTHGSVVEPGDYIFRVGNNNTPAASWSLAPAPASISVRAGAGVGGSDRIEIIWNTGDITKKWLQVVMKTDAGTDTGLAQLAGYTAGYGDVFYFGNALADSGLGDTSTLANVDSTDELEARNHPQTVFQTVLITNIRDYNRDAIVDTTDALLSRNNATTGLAGASPSLRFLLLAAGSPPNAPEGDGGDGGGDGGGGGGSVPSAVAMTSGSSSTSESTPTWLADSLSSSSASGSNGGGATGTALLQLLGEEDSQDGGDEDDDELTSLLADLGLE
jgi:hypothetical protein